MVNIWYDPLTGLPHTIHINENSVEAAINRLQRCIDEGLVKPIEYRWATLEIDEEDNESLFPLVFSSKEGCSLSIANASAMEDTEESRGTLSYLDMMGFELTSQEKKQILSVPADGTTLTMRFRK